MHILDNFVRWKYLAASCFSFVMSYSTCGTIGQDFKKRIQDIVNNPVYGPVDTDTSYQEPQASDGNYVAIGATDGNDSYEQPQHYTGSKYEIPAQGVRNNVNEYSELGVGDAGMYSSTLDNTHYLCIIKLWVYHPTIDIPGSCPSMIVSKKHFLSWKGACIPLFLL